MAYDGQVTCNLSGLLMIDFYLRHYPRRDDFFKEGRAPVCVKGKKVIFNNCMSKERENAARKYYQPLKVPHWVVLKR